ncbi:MAG: dTDP-glucose 4,6-dehydratase [Gemmatimonadetes bacterium]|nr:dTDP-glucose 4,6-dehydratase [Gemmatimonadota bacterium]
MRSVLITGGAGFIGSNYTRMLCERHPDYKITVLDALTYAGRRENLADLESAGNIDFVHGDIQDVELVDHLVAEHEWVVHFAAETHNDRSIMEAGSFISTDVNGTFVLLEAARKHACTRFVHISTDEVYGDALDGPSLETSPLNPKSPYSASKAGADRLAYSYYQTFEVPVVITRCTNNYGPYQYPEKLIPLFTTNLLEDRSVPVYGSGGNTRDWIHVLDHCEAVDILLHDTGHLGEVFNVSSGVELSILDVTDALLKLLGKSKELIHMVTDRPGHVVAHSVDSSKFREVFGWKPAHSFNEGLTQTVEWYSSNEAWWRAIKEESEEFRRYYAEQYPDLNKED